MPFIVVYDANALYPNTLRDLLIRIAQQPHLVQAKWTNEILDEMLRALRKNMPDITEEQAARLRERMNNAVRDCLVEGYELPCRDQTVYVPILRNARPLRRHAPHQRDTRRSCGGRSAEGVGFEPTSKVTPASGFQDH